MQKPKLQFKCFNNGFTQHSTFAKRKLSAGFTIAELLVTISIIAVLAAIVLASIGVVRTKSQDAAIKANLITIRAQAELYYSNNNDYGDDVAGDCLTAGTMFIGDIVIANAIATILNTNGGNALTCAADDGVVAAGTSAISWAISSPLQGGGDWCVDVLATSKSGVVQIVANIALCS